MRRPDLRTAVLAVIGLALAGCTSYSPTTAAAEEWDFIRSQRTYPPAPALAAGDHLGTAVYEARTPYQLAGPTRYAEAASPTLPGR
jgi:hypothetical protein